MKRKDKKEMNETQRNNGMKRKRMKRIIFILAPALFLSIALWITLRHTAAVSCTPWDGAEEERYSEEEKVFSSMSLSFLVYGCEECGAHCETVENILDTQKPGIVAENADILRTDKSDPAAALIDSASFIRQTVGNYRFLMDLRDEKCGFYAAAFADDEKETVWISYAGSVSFADAVQSALLVLGAGPSGQEKRAFEFYEAVLDTEEIQSSYRLILTGHSLGGALASMVSRLSGAEAVTINGADGLGLRKINSLAKNAPAGCRIANYLTLPEKGAFTLKDLVQRVMFAGDYDGIACHTYGRNGMTGDCHCIFSFVRFEDGDLSKPFLPMETVR